MKNKNRILALCIILSLILYSLVLCSGCWSSKEVENLALVTLVGIDLRKENGREIWKASALVLFPQRAQGEGGQSGQLSAEKYFEGEGPTPQTAILAYSKRMSRTPFYGYISGYIIGENVARENLIHCVESVARYWQTRPRNIYFLARGQACDVLKAGGALDRLSNELIEFSDYRAAATGQSVGVYRYQLEEWLTSNDRDAVLGVIQPVPVPEAENNSGGSQGGAQSGGGQSGSSMGGNENTPMKNVIEGIAVFRDDKLVGFLNREETEGFLLISREITRGQMAIAVEKDNQMFTYFLSESKSKIKPIVNNGQISYQVTIQTKGGVNDQPGFTLGIKEIHELEEAVNERLKAKALAAIEKAKEYDSDFLGFAEALHRKKPKVWKTFGPSNWREAFTKADIEVIVKSKIVNTGTIGDKLEIQRNPE
ncbi:MAG: Ger(x)C family spore germination protein [Peptococcaceae bacterium]|nr:Ger(x)C family spore germination protein [Peptococcaceae bacterium]